MLTETVYNDRNNLINLLLKSDGTAKDLSAITKMEIIERNEKFTISSTDSPDAFDWDSGETGEVILALGEESLEAGKHFCDLIIYTATYTDGVRWDEFALFVVD